MKSILGLMTKILLDKLSTLDIALSLLFLIMGLLWNLILNPFKSSKSKFKEEKEGSNIFGLCILFNVAVQEMKFAAICIYSY